MWRRFIEWELTAFSTEKQLLAVSGGASAVKDAGHFEVRKSSSYVIWSLGCTFSQKVTTFFSHSPQNISRQCHWWFQCQNKTKCSDMVTVLFSVHLLPKQSNRQGGARVVDLPARSFDLACPVVVPPLLAVAAYYTVYWLSSCLCLVCCLIS